MRPLTAALVLAFLASVGPSIADEAPEDPLSEARHKLDLGDHFLDDGRIPKALEFYTWAARIAPTWWKPHYKLGQALQLARRPAEEVLAHFRRALSASPDVYIVLVAMGEVHEEAGDWPAAEKTYREAMEVAGPVERILVRLGAVLLEQRKWDEARRVLEEATRHDPGPAVYHQLAQLARTSGDVEEEERHLRILLVRAPDPAPYASRLGIILQQTGRTRAAEQLSTWLRGDRQTAPPRL
ncbi:MAG: tetratricopeptide repeat protein [Pseudomonadota bacterium]